MFFVVNGIVTHRVGTVFVSTTLVQHMLFRVKDTSPTHYSIPLPLSSKKKNFHLRRKHLAVRICCEPFDIKQYATHVITYELQCLISCTRTLIMTLTRYIGCKHNFILFTCPFHTNTLKNRTETNIRNIIPPTKIGKHLYL